MNQKIKSLTIIISAIMILSLSSLAYGAIHPDPEKHLVIEGDPANDNRVIVYDVTIVGGVTRLGPEANPSDDLIVGTNITAKIYSGIIQGQDVTTDDYFFTGTLESIKAPQNLIATVDGVPFPVTIVEPPPEPGKHLEIRGDPANLINTAISYTVTISGGTTRLGLTTGIGDVVIGTNIEGITKARLGFDEYFFTGDILSVNLPVNLLVTVDGVPFPVTIDGIPSQKQLIIAGDPNNPTNAKVSYAVTISGGVTQLGTFANAADSIIGTNALGTILSQTGKDSYLFTGTLESINSPVNLVITVGVPPPPDPEPDPSDLEQRITELERKVNILEQAWQIFINALQSFLDALKGVFV